MTTTPPTTRAAPPKAPAAANPQPPAAAARPAPAKRMSLDKLVRGKLERPRRILLYGTEGIGKSTFGSGAPRPIFLTPEPGSDRLDVVRFPQPETWQDILDAVTTLTNDPHEFRTLVLDTLDSAEAMLWKHMIHRDSTNDRKLVDIEDYGYGKGYQKALDDWRVFLAALERLRQARQMHIVMLAHAWIRPFKNPTGDDFDRYEMKLNPKAGGLLKEWNDCVLFANYETYAHKDEKTKRIRGVSTGARLIHATRTAAWDAKNRYGLPETLSLSWDDFEQAATAGAVADPAVLRAEITRKARELGGEIEPKALELMKKAEDDPTALALINNRLSARIAEKEG